MAKKSTTIPLKDVDKLFINYFFQRKECIWKLSKISYRILFFCIIFFAAVVVFLFIGIFILSIENLNWDLLLIFSILLIVFIVLISKMDEDPLSDIKFED